MSAVERSSSAPLDAARAGQCQDLNCRCRLRQSKVQLGLRRDSQSLNSEQSPKKRTITPERNALLRGTYRAPYVVSEQM
jgi:hypothetical protein